MGVFREISCLLSGLGCMAFSQSLSITASVEGTLPACRVVSVTMNTDHGHYPLDEALFAEQLAASLALWPPESYPMQVGVPWCNGFYLVTFFAVFIVELHVLVGRVWVFKWIQQTLSVMAVLVTEKRGGRISETGLLHFSVTRIFTWWPRV